MKKSSHSGMSCLGVCAAAVVLVACSGNDQSSGVATTTETPSVASTELLSASELEALVVSPPDPYAQQPDDVISTGLMEPGNPDSGVIGIGFSTERELVDEGFKRGWEKYFRTPDAEPVVINVFQFADDRGPSNLMGVFEDLDEPGFERRQIEGVPSSSVLSGTSPEGRDSLLAAFAHGPFLVVVGLGGPPGARDYNALLQDIAARQLAALP